MPYMLTGMEKHLAFVVVPVNGQSGMGFWVQAADANEARLLKRVAV